MVFFIFIKILTRSAAFNLDMQCLSMSHKKDDRLKWINVHAQLFMFLIYTFGYHDALEPWHGISNNVVCATSKASDQPAHTRSLVRAFASRLNIL